VMMMYVDGEQLSLSRLNHWLPRGQTHPEVMQVSLSRFMVYGMMRL
jgi:hypothetical protein